LGTEETTNEMYSNCNIILKLFKQPSSAKSGQIR